MQSKAVTVDQYLAELEPTRREAIEAIRRVILRNLSPGFEEGTQYGMIGYFVPHSIYPKGYHCDPRQPLPFVSLASQKNHIGLYLFCVYMDEARRQRFVESWTATGKRLDMGKGCVRVRNLAGVPLEVVGEAVRGVSVSEFLSLYESNLAAPRTRPPAKTKATTKKPAAKKSTATKAATKKTAMKKTGAKKSATRQTGDRKAAASKAGGPPSDRSPAARGTVGGQQSMVAGSAVRSRTRKAAKKGAVPGTTARARGGSK